MRFLVYAIILAAAAILTACGHNAPKPEPLPELRAGDVYWVCDLEGHCECQAIGAAKCPEVGP